VIITVEIPDNLVDVAREYFMNYGNVLNVSKGKKVVNGKVTDIDSIIVYVPEKLPTDNLIKCGIKPLPKVFNGIPIDVIELKAKFKIGNTSVSKLPYTLQKRLAGGVK